MRNRNGTTVTIAVIVAIIGLARATGAQPVALPYSICAASDTWTRPTPAVQSKIWDDHRYKPDAPTSYEWTHDFLLTEPDSASLSHHSANLSGLWTAAWRSACPRRDGEHGSWIELWTLQHRVAMITADGSIVTVSAEPRAAGFEIVQIRLPSFLEAAPIRLRVVAANGVAAAEWMETRPRMFTPVSAVK